LDIFINKTKLSIIQGDITNQATDAIVNAANSGLMGGGGVDGAIHKMGGPVILEECKRIISKQGKLPAGKAVITTGGNLKARYVIHTVGPVWHGGQNKEETLLADAYGECLNIASENNIFSISFPSISTGVFGYPVEKACRVALKTIIHFIREKDNSIKEIVFVLFDPISYKCYCSEAKNLTAESL
jgi:O-acetyl-ADP-ribose deacetylase